MSVVVCPAPGCKNILCRLYVNTPNPATGRRTLRATGLHYCLSHGIPRPAAAG